MPSPADPPSSAEATLRARVRAQSRIAGELCDEVIHRVAAVSLQVIGHRASHDVAELQAVLDTIAATTAETFASLRLLDRVLRAEQPEIGSATSGGGVTRPALVVSDSVAQVVEEAAQPMREAGLQVKVALPESGDGSSSTTRRTLAQAVRVAGQAIAWRAAPCTLVTIEMAVSSSRICLRVSAPVPEWGTDVLDPEVVKLEERARLTEGTLWTGIDQVGPSLTWSLVLRLRDG